MPRARLLATGLLVAALGLAGCGGTDDGKAAPSPSPSPTAPTPTVEVPSGVTLTDPGTTLDFGQPATVPYRPNDRRGSVLELTVTSVRRATIDDFAAYVLDKRTRRSTPYYVKVTVANAGTGDVGGTDVPLWAVDGSDTLVHSSTFTNSFQRCPSQSLPKRFGPGERLRTCLVYLLPDRGELTAVSFRPLQAFAPIEWHGTVEGPAKHAKQGKKKDRRQTS